MRGRMLWIWMGLVMLGCDSHPCSRWENKVCGCDGSKSSEACDNAQRLVEQAKSLEEREEQVRHEEVQDQCRAYLDDFEERGGCDADGEYADDAAASDG